MSAGRWGWNPPCWKRMLRTGTCKWMKYCHCLGRLLLFFLLVRGLAWPSPSPSSASSSWRRRGLVCSPSAPGICSESTSRDGGGLSCWGFLCSLRPCLPDGTYPTMRLLHWVNFKLGFKSSLHDKTKPQNLAVVWEHLSFHHCLYEPFICFEQSLCHVPLPREHGWCCTYVQLRLLSAKVNFN